MTSSWQIGPFRRLEEVNPILSASDEVLWNCPLKGELHWEAKDVFNPAAVVKDGKVHLLYRAEDKVGPFNGTSRIGLASSSDGIAFEKLDAPVVYPTDDGNYDFEKEGGCEDPRICLREDGVYVMHYTAFDGVKARLCVATSTNLIHWQKHGLAFPDFPELWCKAGSVVCALDGDNFVAVKIRGLYWMYWGESYIFAAVSEDLLTWRPLTHQESSPAGPGFLDELSLAPLAPESEGSPQFVPSAPNPPSRWVKSQVGISVSEREAFVSVLRPRRGRFDSELVEPGPPALLTEDGIVLMYHGKNAAVGGDPNLPAGAYCVAQALFDPQDPTALLSRPTTPFLSPSRAEELTGQIPAVCFAEGMVWFEGRWLLYFGVADSRVSVAVCG